MAAIVIDRFKLPVTPLLSVTWTVKLDVPAVVGVPLIIPVDRKPGIERSDNPPGRAPDVIAQVVKAPLPLEAARVCE